MRNVKPKWRTAPVPTGRYKSFEQRGWPSAHLVVDGVERPIARLVCEDDYRPSKVRLGDHAPISIRIADYGTAFPDRDGAFTWRHFTAKRARTLDEAKTLVLEILQEMVRNGRLDHFPPGFVP